MQRRDFIKMTGAAIVVSVTQPVSAQDVPVQATDKTAAAAEPGRAPLDLIEAKDVKYVEALSNGRFCTFCSDARPFEAWDAFEPF